MGSGEVGCWTFTPRSVISAVAVLVFYCSSDSKKAGYIGLSCRRHNRALRLVHIGQSKT